MDGLDLWMVVERVGVLFATVIIFSMIASRFLTYLDNQQKIDKAERESWDKIRKDDNQQWVTLITGLKMSIEAQGMTAGENYKTMAQDRINTMAYQNTTASALSELLALNKEMRGVPDGVREANKTLGIIQKSQHGLTEHEARRELEFKSELAKMNNAMLGIQTAVSKLETAIGSLPSAMQKSIAPILTTLDEILATAKSTQAVIEDLPLVENGSVEKDLSEDKPHPLTPSPLHGEGELVTPLNGGDGSHSVKTEGENMPANGQN